jgi:hypothetical protein
VTQQCQLSATIMGQSAAGIGATIGMAKSGPAVIAAADKQKQRSNRLQDSRPLLKRQESPLPRRKDDAPMLHSLNDSRTHNGYPTNRSSRRINSLAGQATPLADEAGVVSPSP